MTRMMPPLSYPERQSIVIASTAPKCRPPADRRPGICAYDVVLALLSSGRPDRSEAVDHWAWATDVVSSWPADWSPVIAEAEHHGVTPLAARAVEDLSRRGIAVPEAASRAFAALAVRHRAIASGRERALDELLSTFADGGVTVLLLKGAALGHTLYGDPALRPMADLDLLVADRDVHRAIELVQGCGFAFDLAYGSRFAANMHHLPAARSTRPGFPLSLDLHVDALSPDQPERMTIETLAEPPRPVDRGAGPPGLTLGHTDMLRHLCRHAFEPATRIRLVHLHDVWRYGRHFGDAIDWAMLSKRSPGTIIAHRLAVDMFERDRAREAGPLACGEGRAMTPMAEIAASQLSFSGRLRALLDPPAWWMHGFYGIEPGRSLMTCRSLRHPATVARWISHRLLRRGVASWRARPVSPSRPPAANPAHEAVT